MKLQTEPPPGGWYPFESLTAAGWIGDMLAPFWNEIFGAEMKGPMADLACGDGGLSLLFASCGVQVDAIDLRKNNFNKMRGVELLQELASLPVKIYDIDLDGRFDFPSNKYSLTLFLGTLYRLNNPYYLLEGLAYRTDWCILSTPIAQFTRRTLARVEEEPIA